jgi:hypothetical protein
MDPVIDAYKAGIDRTLLRENLKLTVEQRFLELMDLQRFAEEMRKAGQNARWQCVRARRRRERGRDVARAHEPRRRASLLSSPVS